MAFGGFRPAARLRVFDLRVQLLSAKPAGESTGVRDGAQSFLDIQYEVPCCKHSTTPDVEVADPLVRNFGVS